MSNERQFEQVNGGSNNERWQPQKEQGVLYSDKNPAVLEGYFILRNPVSHQGKNWYVHEIHTLNDDGSLGKVKDVVLGIGLQNTLEKIDLGTYIRLEYKGKKPAKTPGQIFNDVSVAKDPNAIPYAQLSGVSAKVAPSTATAGVGAGSKNPVSNPFPEGNDLDELPF